MFFSRVKGFVTKRSQSSACTVRLWGVFGSDILQGVVSFTITSLQCFVLAKGQKILKQNCRATTSPKKQTNNFVFYPDDLEILEI